MAKKKTEQHFTAPNAYLNRHKNIIFIKMTYHHEN